MAKRRYKKDEHPITLAEWCDNIEMLKRDPEGEFGIPEPLVTHIQIAEANVGIPVSDDEEVEVLVLRISLLTNMGAVFDSANIYCMPDMTSGDMLKLMHESVDYLVSRSGFDNTRLPDGSWLTNETVEAMKNALMMSNAPKN